MNGGLQVNGRQVNGGVKMNGGVKVRANGGEHIAGGGGVDDTRDLPPPCRPSLPSGTGNHSSLLPSAPPCPQEWRPEDALSLHLDELRCMVCGGQDNEDQLMLCDG